MAEKTLVFPIAHCLSCPLTLGVDIDGDTKEGYFIFDAAHLSETDRKGLEDAIKMVTDTDPSLSDEYGKLVFRTKRDRYSSHREYAIQFAELIKSTCNLDPELPSFPQPSAIGELFDSPIPVAMSYKAIAGTADFPIISAEATRPLRRLPSASDRCRHR